MSSVSASVVSEVEALYSDMSRAFVARNLKSLGKLLHDDLRVVAADGSVGDKSSWLANVGSEFKNYDFRDANFSVLSTRRVDRLTVTVYVSKEIVSIFDGSRRYDTRKSTREVLVKEADGWIVKEIDNFSVDLRINNKSLPARELKTISALMQGCQNGFP